MTENITSDSNGLYTKDYSILQTYTDVNLNISFQGNNDFTSQSISKSYDTIIESKTTLTLTTTKATMTTTTESSVITAKLVDSTNNPIANETIIISKGTYTLLTGVTNSNGEVSYTYPATEGTATITSKYAGNESTYDSSSASTNITVSITPPKTKENSTVSISLSSGSIYTGDSVNITVTGKGTIKIGTTNGGDNIGTVTDSGTVSFTPSSSCTIYAVSSGNDDYYGASNSTSVTVSAKPSTPTYNYITPNISISGNTNPVAGTTQTYVIDKDSLPSGTNVVCYLDDSQLCVTSDNSFTCSMSNGNHTLKINSSVAINGNIYYNSATATLGVTAYTPIPTKDTTLSLSISSNNVVWGEPVTITANSNIPNVQVKIFVNGVSNTTTTNSSGVASISTTFPKPQTASVYAEILSGSKGDYDYTNAMTGDSKITVLKRATSIGNMRTQIAKGEAWSCMVIDEKNANVVGRKVHITNKLYNTTQTSDLGYCITNTSGVCETAAINYDLKNAYIGFYPTFGGDDYYEGCTDGVWCNYNSAGA